MTVNGGGATSADRPGVNCPKTNATYAFSTTAALDVTAASGENHFMTPIGRYGGRMPGPELRLEDNCLRARGRTGTTEIKSKVRTRYIDSEAAVIRVTYEASVVEKSKTGPGRIRPYSIGPY